MKKILMIICFFTAFVFAGNFQKASDTLRVVYYQDTPAHVDHYWYNPPRQPVTVHYVRTAPYHCHNVNCPRPVPPLPPRGHHRHEPPRKHHRHHK